MNSFAQFIEEFTCNDKNLELHLQELFGCILTNNLQYKTCILLHGTGNNGKSLLIKLLVKAMMYQTLIDMMDDHGFFTEPGNSGKSPAGKHIVRWNDLANIEEKLGTLVGKNLCIVEEADQMEVFPSGMIKSLLGNDPIFYVNEDGEGCTFINKSYFVLVSNTYIQVDVSMQRRMVKIPCLAEPEVDPNLLKKLSDPNIIMEMVDWMHEGNFRVRQQGYINMY